MGKATVSFGLVSIPVKIYTSVDSSGSVSFNLLDPDKKTRLRQQLYNPQTGEPVERGEAVKGYEFAKDQYVTFTQEELDELQAQSNKAIEITEFLPRKEIDPVYFAKAYYLAPDQGGDRAYALLTEALKKSGLVALARYAARGKEYLVMLRTMEGALVMQQLRYYDEVRALDEIPVPDVEVKDDELKLAMQLVDQVSTDEFQPEKYQDTVSQRVKELIQKKVEGEDIVSAAAGEAPKAQIIDLMSALKASLGEEGEGEERKSAKSAKGKEAKERAKAK